MVCWFCILTPSISVDNSSVLSFSHPSSHCNFTLSETIFFTSQLLHLPFLPNCTLQEAKDSAYCFNPPYSLWQTTVAATMQPGDFNLDLQVDLGRKSSKSASGEAKKFNTINVTRKGGRPRSEPELSISFHRTVRVTDNDDSVNALPPNLGKFPLYKTDDFEKRLPSNIEKSGKILLPMYRKRSYLWTKWRSCHVLTGTEREAMWINFSGNERFAIRIYVGGVNVVSGLSVLENPTTLLKRWKMYEENKSLQDYVVVPDQLWLGKHLSVSSHFRKSMHISIKRVYMSRLRVTLTRPQDGVASEDGSIRQFVAMPTGSGYSVEAQITGEEAIRGIQFEITPAKYNGCDHVFVQLSNGRSLVLNHLEPHMRISRLKSMIRDETGVPIVQQRLVFAGVQLENGKSWNPDWEATYLFANEAI